VDVGGGRGCYRKEITLENLVLYIYILYSFITLDIIK